MKPVFGKPLPVVEDEKPMRKYRVIGRIEYHLDVCDTFELPETSIDDVKAEAIERADSYFFQAECYDSTLKVEDITDGDPFELRFAEMLKLKHWNEGKPIVDSEVYTL